VSAATPTPLIVPILSGGGTRLPCYVGILRALSHLGLGYQHIVGVSGGSIVASLAAAGWSSERMEALALHTDFNQFKGFSPLLLLRHGGLSSGDHFEHWMDSQLEGRRFIDLPAHLHVLATDINGGGPVVFSRQHTPQMKVSKAVRFSMSIPLLFTFKTFEGHIMADGVILAEDALHQDWAGDGTPAVCFRLRSQAKRRDLTTNRLVPLATYLQLLVQTFMNAVSREYVHAEYWHNTIVVNTGDVSPTDFTLPEATRRQLLGWGYETTLAFLPRKMALHRPLPDSPAAPAAP
jgi:NTE family protein